MLKRAPAWKSTPPPVVALVANMSLMLLSCHRSQCCGSLSSLFCVALLSFAKTNLTPSALWCNLIFSHLHTWEKHFYVCFKNLRNRGRFVRPGWHKPSAASLAARRRLSPGQRPFEKMCHMELETSFLQKYKILSDLKKKRTCSLGLGCSWKPKKHSSPSSFGRDWFPAYPVDLCLWYTKWKS